MLRFAVFALLAVSLVAGLEEITPKRPEILSGRFQVPVNHFWPQDGRTVSFPYEYDIDYYDVGGPLFFYINDGGVYTNEWITQGLMYEIARELSGALFTTDMRFFRLNLPTENASFNNLSLLTIEQILADIAAFVTQVRQQLEVPPFANVYLWGNGFGGTLATLARQKYPFLIHGAWSSGGIFEPAVFTTDNYDILSSNIFEYGGDPCAMRVHQAFHEIEHMLMMGHESMLVEEFSICRPWNISNHMDVGIFSENLIGQISDFFDANNHDGVLSFCRAMHAIPSDPMRSLSRWVRFTYNADFGRCFNYDYNGRIRWASDINWHNPGTATGMRQWTYLQCSQFGQLRITQQDGMFGNRVTERYRHQVCTEAFGPSYDFERLHLSVNDLRTAFGGRQPGVTRVIFSNNMLNPWFSHGITFYYGAETHVVNTPGYGATADLSSINRRDSTSMYNSKTIIMNAFRSWERPSN